MLRAIYINTFLFSNRVWLCQTSNNHDDYNYTKIISRDIYCQTINLRVVYCAVHKMYSEA